MTPYSGKQTKGSVPFSRVASPFLKHLTWPPIQAIKQRVAPPFSEGWGLLEKPPGKLLIGLDFWSQSLVGCFVSMGMDDLLKCVHHPFVKTFSSMNGSHSYFTMQWGICSNHKFTRKRFVWFPFRFFATLKIKINRLMKSFFQFTDRLAMKTNRITDTNNVAKQNVIIRVKFNFGRVAFIIECIHVVTPTLLKKSLAFLTWYRFASFPGCGLWKSPFSLLMIKDTREPSPSMTLAFKAMNNASIFRHSRLPGVGCEKIASKVFWCFLFTSIRY